MNKLAFALLAYGVLFYQTVSFAAGLAVYPMEQFVRPGRPVFYVASNTQDKAIAVQVMVESWEIDGLGKEIRKPTDDLVAYPVQFILKGHTTKRIKVGSRERKPIPIERAYRVTIQELPVYFELPEGQTQVYMANAYRTSYYLQPLKKEAAIEILDSGLNDGILWFQFENNGNVHTHVQTPSLTLNLEDGESLDLTESELIDALGGENLHARSQRRFEIDLSSLNLEQRVVSGELSVKSGHNGETRSFTLAF